MQVSIKAGFQAGIGPDEILHQLVVYRHDHHQILPVVLHGLQQGDKVTVSIPALDGKECTATVNYIAVRESYATWKATKETGMYDAKTFEVRAVPDTKVDGLRPGMSAIIKDAKLLKK